MSVVKKVTLDTLAEELGGDLSRLGAKALRGARAGARHAQSIVMRNTPVDTGRLRASWLPPDGDTNFPGGGVTDTPDGAVVTNAAPYAGVVDHRQGFVEDVYDEMRDAVVEDIKRAVSR